MIPDKFSILIIIELIDESGGAMINSSKQDLKLGYHQIRLRENDIPKAVFRTREGLYDIIKRSF